MNFLIRYLQKSVSLPFARWSFFVILLVSFIYHLLIFFSVVPFDQVWGGRLKSQSEMLQSESVSILLNLFFVMVWFLAFRLPNTNRLQSTLSILFYLMSFLFMLNTLGNILAVTAFERYALTPLTLLAAILSLRLAYRLVPTK